MNIKTNDENYEIEKVCLIIGRLIRDIYLVYLFIFS